jgi:hypothetical protein
LDVDEIACRERRRREKPADAERRGDRDTEDPSHEEHLPTQLLSSAVGSIRSQRTIAKATVVFVLCRTQPRPCSLVEAWITSAEAVTAGRLMRASG